MKNNDQYNRARKGLKDKTTRRARVARNSELNRLRSSELPRSFQDYVDMKESYKAPLMKRAGDAWNAAKLAFNRSTVTSPDTRNDGGHFHEMEKDVQDIVLMARSMRTPEMRRMANEFAKQASELRRRHGLDLIRRDDF